MSDHLLSRHRRAKEKPSAPTGPALLTPREREICTLLAHGHTNGEIAEKLCISERTVETHRMNVMAKLNMRTRAELVRFAIENQIAKFR